MTQKEQEGEERERARGRQKSQGKERVKSADFFFILFAIRINIALKEIASSLNTFRGLTSMNNFSKKKS